MSKFYAESMGETKETLVQISAGMAVLAYGTVRTLRETAWLVGKCVLREMLSLGTQLLELDYMETAEEIRNAAGLDPPMLDICFNEMALREIGEQIVDLTLMSAPEGYATMDALFNALCSQAAQDIMDIEDRWT